MAIGQYVRVRAKTGFNCSPSVLSSRMQFSIPLPFIPSPPVACLDVCSMIAICLFCSMMSFCCPAKQQKQAPFFRLFLLLISLRSRSCVDSRRPFRALALSLSLSLSLSLCFSPPHPRFPTTHSLTPCNGLLIPPSAPFPLKVSAACSLETRETPSSRIRIA